MSAPSASFILSLPHASHLGALRFAEKDFEQASVAYEAGLAFAPDDLKEALRLRVATNRKQKKWGASIADAVVWLRLSGVEDSSEAHGDVLLTYAEGCYRLGEVEAAEVVLHHTLTSRTNWGEAVQLLKEVEAAKRTRNQTGSTKLKNEEPGCIEAKTKKKKKKKKKSEASNPQPSGFVSEIVDTIFETNEQPLPVADPSTITAVATLLNNLALSGLKTQAHDVAASAAFGAARLLGGTGSGEQKGKALQRLTTSLLHLQQVALVESLVQRLRVEGDAVGLKDRDVALLQTKLDEARGVFTWGPILQKSLSSPLSSLDVTEFISKNIAVKHYDGKGRGIMATADFSEGALILVNRAMVFKDCHLLSNLAQEVLDRPGRLSREQCDRLLAADLEKLAEKNPLIHRALFSMHGGGAGAGAGGGVVPEVDTVKASVNARAEAKDKPEVKVEPNGIQSDEAQQNGIQNGLAEWNQIPNGEVDLGGKKKPGLIAELKQSPTYDVTPKIEDVTSETKINLVSGITDVTSDSLPPPHVTPTPLVPPDTFFINILSALPTNYLPFLYDQLHEISFRLEDTKIETGKNLNIENTTLRGRTSTIRADLREQILGILHHNAHQAIPLAMKFEERYAKTMRHEGKTEDLDFTGLWCLPCMINHSERPNVLWASLGDFMIVRAIRPIKAGDELKCMYTGFQPWNHRKTSLQELGVFYDGPNGSNPELPFSDSVWRQIQDAEEKHQKSQNLKMATILNPEDAKRLFSDAITIIDGILESSGSVLGRFDPISLSAFYFHKADCHGGLRDLVGLCKAYFIAIQWTRVASPFSLDLPTRLVKLRKFLPLAKQMEGLRPNGVQPKPKGVSRDVKRATKAEGDAQPPGVECDVRRLTPSQAWHLCTTDLIQAEVERLCVAAVTLIYGSEDALKILA